MVITGGGVRTREDLWLSTSILLLVRIGVGDFFSRMAFRWADFSSVFVRQSLALSFLLSTVACYQDLSTLTAPGHGILRRCASCVNPIIW